MPIYPLPQFEDDLKQLEAEDRALYESMKAPKTLVVRYGAMNLVGEFPYDGSAKPGCGSKLIVRSPRGTEMGEMLTSTCPNSGCGKSVSRKQMLDYIENSGGRDYPFFTDGRVLRIATKEDMDHQARLEQSRHELRMDAKRRAEAMGLPMKLVDAEALLGGERIIFYFNSDDRIDFRELVRELQIEHRTRVEMRQVGARDEARLTADYEKCGQYCCCKNFLKVLKPISMKSAKVQKATLDPLKISGRCGRLMCCLRYEDETYEDLRKRLPRKKSRVGTPDGDGTVIDGQILTQLVLVRLDAPDKDGNPADVAVPVENLTPPTSAAAPVRPEPRPIAPGPGMPPRERPPHPGERPRERRPEPRPPAAPAREPDRAQPPLERPARPPAPRPQPPRAPQERAEPGAPQGAEPPRQGKKRRRRRRRGGNGGGPPGPGDSPAGPPQGAGPA